VKGLGAAGNTNVHDALLTALALETKRARGAPALRTDQVLFLTDGRANRGGVQDRDAIRILHRETHRLTRVRFDCVGLGTHDRELLEGLAADCGGRYVSVGE
jgi:Mg-chelatase subunit ChlD